MTPLTSFDKRQLRDVLGTFTTGVTIVTTRDAAGNPQGVTANSFSSVSLDPPLVLWSQALSSRSYRAFRDSDHFTVNILADNQVGISNHFAKPQVDKFDGIKYSAGLGGAPVLQGSAAHLECVKVATYPGGDHVVYLGRVACVGLSSRRPLAFGRGRYMVSYAHELDPVSLQLGNARTAPIAAIRLAIEALPAICAAVGEHTLCLAVWGNHGPTVIHIEPSRRPVSKHLRAGMVLNVTNSATGLAFAAFLAGEVTHPFIDEGLRLIRAADEDDGTQRQRFDEEIAQIRARGLVSLAQSETAFLLHEVATNAFAAPVFDKSGMVMALTLVSPASRLDQDWDGPVPCFLAETARDLSRRLGWLEELPSDRRAHL